MKKILTLAVALLLSTTLTGCLMIGFGRGGFFLWPRGLGLIILILIIVAISRRRRY